ncbi:MAG TPA: hypothetical protein VLF40_01695 [Candidatus Saccharimonadales bacterium]|nr:hypothetical protein [Candidatus Saccharimonadales bacterium]
MEAGPDTNDPEARQEAYAAAVARRDELATRRDELAARIGTTEFADAAVAKLYADALTGLEQQVTEQSRQVTEQGQQLADGLLTEASRLATAYEQVQALLELGGDPARVAEQSANYVGRLEALAGRLAGFELDQADPRLETIMRVSKAVGGSAVAAASSPAAADTVAAGHGTPVPIPTQRPAPAQPAQANPVPAPNAPAAGPAAEAPATGQTRPAAEAAIDPSGKEAGDTPELVTDLSDEEVGPKAALVIDLSDETAAHIGDLYTVADALNNLVDYTTANPGRLFLRPSDLARIILPGVTYIRHRHRPFFTALIDEARAINIYLSYNFGRTKAAGYFVERITDAQAQSGYNPDAVAALEAAQSDSEFDIDTYFSARDAQTLAAFLGLFNQLFTNLGVEPLDGAVVDRLLAVDTEHEDTRADTDPIAITRLDILTRIVSLVNNSDLAVAAIDNLPADDPRTAFFEYLVDLIDDATLPLLTELVNRNKTLLYELHRGYWHTGQRVREVRSEVSLPDHLIQEFMERRTQPSPGTTPYKNGRSEHAASTTSQPEQTLFPLDFLSGTTPSVAPDAAPPEPIASSSQPPEPRAELSRAEQRRRAAIVACRKTVGDILRRMQDSGLDLDAEYRPTSLYPYFGKRLRTDLGSAKSGGLRIRPGSGHRNADDRIKLEEAFLAHLGNEAPRVSEYVRTHLDDIREVIQDAIKRAKDNQK